MVRSEHPKSCLYFLISDNLPIISRRAEWEDPKAVCCSMEEAACISATNSYSV